MSLQYDVYGMSSANRLLDVMWLSINPGVNRNETNSLSSFVSRVYVCCVVVGGRVKTDSCFILMLVFPKNIINLFSTHKHSNSI